MSGGDLRLPGPSRGIPAGDSYDPVATLARAAHPVVSGRKRRHYLTGTRPDLLHPRSSGVTWGINHRVDSTGTGDAVTHETADSNHDRRSCGCITRGYA